MNIENVSIKLANIVLVFDDLINARISRDSLLDLIPDEENINHIDVGPLFVVKYPESKAEVIILNQERRAEIKIFQPEDDLWTLLPNLCSKVMNAIQESNLTAYGYIS